MLSDKMQKTVVVEVTRLKKHPIYRRYFKVSKHYKAHDEKNEYHVGEKVRIMEVKPISKDKKWVVVARLEVTPKSETPSTPSLESSEVVA